MKHEVSPVESPGLPPSATVDSITSDDPTPRASILMSIWDKWPLKHKQKGAPAKPLAHEVSTDVQSDRPITAREQDRLDRWPFAHRIGQVIASRTDPTSVVIGVYGPWGDGKTSALALIKEALSADPAVVPVDYNPWFFSSDAEAIARSFFQTLGEALQKSKLFSKEKIGKGLADYGGATAILLPGSGDLTKSVGKNLSSTSLRKFRDQVEAILQKHKRKVVVFVDDIDRLERREIQTIFKLVRLAGDFSHTVYVLAFDDDIVSDSLSEAYGSGDKNSGRRFLEKIVQVPLHLPPANSEVLKKWAFASIDRTLKNNEIDISETEAHTIGTYFALGIGAALQTPRQVKLFENALSFAIPILKGEVNVGDQILIEAIRVFYPRLYTVIRDEPQRFLRRQENAKGHTLSELVSASVSHQRLGESAVANCIRLIEHLFPRASNMGYGENWDETWAEQQRICSSEYFNRYFSYGVPRGDLSDRVVERFVASAALNDAVTLEKIWNDVRLRDALKLLVQKLRFRESEIPLDAISAIALEMSLRSHELPRDDDGFIPDWTFRQAAILLAHIVGRLPNERDRVHLLGQLIGRSSLLIFAAETFDWSCERHEDGRRRGFLDEQAQRELAPVLTDRIARELDEQSPWRAFGRDAPRLLYIWKEFGSEQDVRDAVANALRREGPDGAVELIKLFCGRAWGLRDNVASIADFNGDSYSALVKIVSPEAILGTLRQRYGAELDEPEYDHPENAALGRRLAHQFAAVHSARLKKAN